MRKKDFIRLGNQAIVGTAHFELNGELGFIAPFSHFVRGFCFDSSSYGKNDFYLNRMIVPLFVPTEFLHFSFGDRIRSRKGVVLWNCKEEGLIEDLKSRVRNDVAQLIGCANSIEEFIQYATRLEGFNAKYAVAIAHALVGKVNESLVLLKGLGPQLDRSIDWQDKVFSDIATLHDVLFANPLTGLRLIYEWEKRSVSALRMDQYHVISTFQAEPIQL